MLMTSTQHIQTDAVVMTLHWVILVCVSHCEVLSLDDKRVKLPGYYKGMSSSKLRFRKKSCFEFWVCHHLGAGGMIHTQIAVVNSTPHVVHPEQ